MGAFYGRCGFLSGFGSSGFSALTRLSERLNARLEVLLIVIEGLALGVEGRGLGI